MTCYLAVAIWVAAVEDQHLKDLLKQNQGQVVEMLQNYLSQKHKNVSVWAGRAGEIRVEVDGYDFMIQGGKIRDDEREQGERLAELQGALALAADILYADQIERILVDNRMNPRREFVEVKTAELLIQEATVFTARSGKLDMRVIVLPGGRTEIFTDNGSFAQAEAATQALIGQLEAAGIPYTGKSAVEQHRPGGVQHAHANVQMNQH